MDLSDLERVGLYDPKDDDAPKRLELLEYLLTQGITVEEMLVADRENRLPFLLGDRLISPGPGELTIEEVAARIDVPVATVRRLWRALGLTEADPGHPQFSEADVRVLQLLSVALTVFGEAGGLQLTRSIGSAMARVAETGFTLTLNHVEGGFLNRAESYVAAAKASADSGVMAQMTSVILDVTFRHHIEATVRRWDATPSDDPSTVTLAVGFADLVGFTSLSHELTVDQLAEAVTELESLALETIAASSGRLVKVIGDELMFVTATASSACEVALSLLERVDEHSLLPAARASVTVGAVLPYEGDYFGSVVNLASRLTDASRGGELLVPVDVATTLDATHFATGSRHQLSLQGFSGPVEVCSVDRA